MARKRTLLLRGLVIVIARLSLTEIGLRVAGCYHLSHFYVHDLSPGDINILCLGESPAQGMGVGEGDSHPAQLQALLEKHDQRRITAIVPPHVGQNCSQSLVVIMVAGKPRGLPAAVET
jgi:hypothetical protein